LGGAETLADHPMTTRLSDLTPAELTTVGMIDGVVRISVGRSIGEDPLDDFMHILAGG